MTTTVVNNSVFMGFFEKHKLTGPNFIDWYRQLRIVLSAEDKLNYLELPIPATPVLAVAGQQAPLETLAAHAAWVKGQKEIAVLMLMTMEPDLQRNLETLGAYDMLKELKTLFAQQAEQELLQTVREFHACKQEEGQSVSSYVLKMKSYIDNLERLGHPVSLSLAVSLILVSLRKEYDSFVQNYNMHGMGKTVNELHAMLKLHEQTLPKRDAPALHAIRAGKVQKKNKNKKPQLAARGNNKGKGKSKLAYAPKPKIPPPPKKEDPAKDSVCHHCGDTGHWKRNCPQYLSELLKNKKLPQGASTSGALSMYMGNGQRAAVEAIGSYDLCFPSGLVIVLHNCHYAPSITRGVISVSRLYDDGFINRFDDDNTILVSRNNLVYFSVVPRDGIYEIDFSNSITNDHSTYVVSNKRAKLNLDTSLLWHCRIRHISKKRIEKLQQDGLLNSIDTNQEFLDHLKEHGIIAHHTPPYTPQHNGVSERRNRSLLDMVRSMMSQTTLSKSFWDYALESAARILNMISTKKVKKTPYENAEFLENSLITQKSSRSLEDLKIIQEEDTHPSKNISSHHDEGDQEIDEPQSDIIPIRRSTRIRHASDRMCLNIEADEFDKWMSKLHSSMDISLKRSTWSNLKDVKSYIGRCFAMKDLEEVAYILGIKIYRDRSKWLIGLCQSAYIEKILKRYFMKNSKCGSIPMQEKLKLSKSQGASTLAEVKRMQHVPYASANPSELHWTAVKNTPKYLPNTKDMFLVYGGDIKRELRVSCYTDAGYLTDADDLKSQTRYVFVLNGGVVDWMSTKQSIFATSSAEAEYIATSDAFKEALMNQESLKVLYFIMPKFTIFREVIEFGDVKIEKVHTDDNLADPFTKALAFTKHSEHTKNTGMLPASNLM
ncbi:zinc finger, CCHC-type containing protein [Tanacetum coccineum]|uniref:Zinc finger, CCHC-type containing protein n=1 Tax=Tanacetum coccineum TaxID=301880 RepID=A0ABQ4Z6Q5_9ASTR